MNTVFANGITEALALLMNKGIHSVCPEHKDQIQGLFSP